MKTDKNLDYTEEWRVLQVINIWIDIKFVLILKCVT